MMDIARINQRTDGAQVVGAPTQKARAQRGIDSLPAMRPCALALGA
jgi:hypothetical protein